MPSNSYRLSSTYQNAPEREIGSFGDMLFLLHRHLCKQQIRLKSQ
ncbi:hypothetical protein SynBIOSU31_01924 [Synechococcus sp. BIOS-U3-1]|nr:hypothetical protein SynBIOSU31_01924 [Synechococcus sp. BIOS-U3-1]